MGGLKRNNSNYDLQKQEASIDGCLLFEFFPCFPAVYPFGKAKRSLIPPNRIP